ncbi:MAG: hypothetical protein ACTHN5_22155 [Phycisphaerae bacterium]
MSKTISSLNVNVLGNISGLAKSFGGAAGLATGFAGQIAGVGSKIAGLAGIGTVVSGALAGLGATLGGALAVGEQFKAIDATAKLSDRLGVATESLVGMQHAASLAGISGEELTGGFEKMFKTLGTAVGGGKEAVATFNALGLSAQALQSESPDQAFKDIADKISNIANPAQRAAAAMDVFGKSGQSLLPLLTTGAAGISAAQADAQKLGMTFSRLDASKVEAANDAVTRMKGLFTGVASKIAIGLAPIIDFTATNFTNFLSQAVPSLTRFSESWSNMLPAIGGAMAGIFTAVSNIWGNIYNFISEVGAGIYQTVSQNWESMLTTAVSLGMSIWDTTSATFGAMFDLAETVWDGIVGVWNWATGDTIDTTANAEQQTSNIFSRMVSGAQWLADGITTAIQAAEYIIGHWKDYFEMAGTEVDLAIVRTANQIEYVFQEVIPTYVGYGIAVTWAKISDFAANTASLMENLGTNIVSVFKNLPGLIKGSTNWGDVWKPLTAGFEHTVIEWPGIADREKGDLEKQLESESDWLENNFGQGLADHITKRASEAQGIAKTLIKDIKAAGSKLAMPKIASPEVAPKINPNNLSLSITPEIKAASALKVGSAEAQLLKYGGPKLAGIANGSIAAAAPASPPPVSARPATAPNTDAIAAGSGDGKTDSKLRGFGIYLQKIEQNTRTPQLVASSV